MAVEGRVVIVGASHAGVQVAVSLAQAKYAGAVVLLGDEPHLPYHRPPLSKKILSGGMQPDALRLRPEAFYAKAGIDRRTATRVVAIDRAAGMVVTEQGERVGYDHLVLATGARHRRLRVAGADRPGVLALRTRDEAEALKVLLDRACALVVVGAGFIGLEVAAVARARGVTVTMLEAAPRPLARAVSEKLSAALAAAHRRWGTTLLTGTGARAFHGAAGAGADNAVAAVETMDGARIEADLVLVGIGVEPNVDLAASAGLACENGILVDAWMRTSDPAITAIGDCASHPSVFAYDGQVRIESVQNATDQARLVAASIVAGARGTPAPGPYAAVPWFWSDQGPLKLQIAGLTGGHTRTVELGDPAQGPYSVSCYDGERLLGVESIDDPQGHMAARDALAAARG